MKQLIPQISKLQGGMSPRGIEKKQSLGLRRYQDDSKITDPEAIARDLAQWDPSGTEKVPKGLYVSWILKMVGTSQIRLPEDGVRLRNALTIFDKIKLTSRFKGDKDIHKYKNFRELESVTKKFQEGLTQPDEPNNLKTWWVWVKKQGVDLFYKDKKFTVLLFDSSPFQAANGEITKGIEVVSKKTAVGQHGQEIEASWVPLWAAPDANPENAHTVTPTAMALSKLATGTSYCVASPTTAQSYLNSGPLYAIFKKDDESDAKQRGDLYLLANHNWTEFMNQDDKPFDFMTSLSAVFLSKLVIAKSDILGSSAVDNIIQHVKKALKGGKLRSTTGLLNGGDPRTGEWVMGLPPALEEIVTQAININWPKPSDEVRYHD